MFMFSMNPIWQPPGNKRGSYGTNRTMGLYTEAADIIRKVKAKKSSVKMLVLSKSTYPVSLHSTRFEC